MITKKALKVLEKRYTKRIRQMSYEYTKIVNQFPYGVKQDMAPNFRKALDNEHRKLEWIKEKLNGTSLN